MADMKKAIAFIKANAVVKPENIRTTQGVPIPVELVNEIKAQIKKNGGSFAIPAKAFNEEMGWNNKYGKSYYLKKKLNADYPLDKQEWHVGSISKGEFYLFEIREEKEEEDEELED